MRLIGTGTESPAALPAERGIVAARTKDFAARLVFALETLVFCLRRHRPVGGRVQFCFADHTLDTNTRELRRGDTQISVPPQVFDLLTYLVQNRERVVSKDDLLEAVWGAGSCRNRR